MKKIYLFDKITGNVTHVWGNSKIVSKYKEYTKEIIKKIPLKVNQVEPGEAYFKIETIEKKYKKKINSIEDIDCNEDFARRKLDLIKDGKYNSILDKITEKDFENLGWMIHDEVEASSSKLRVESDSEGNFILKTKPYLKINIISNDVSALEDKGAMKKFSFVSDSQRPLTFRVEAFNYSDFSGRPSFSDTRNTEINLKIKVHTERGRLCNKNGIYTLTEGECTCNLVLPDESLKVLVHAGYEIKNHTDSPVAFSAPIIIECI